MLDSALLSYSDTYRCRMYMYYILSVEYTVFLNSMEDNKLRELRVNIHLNNYSELNRMKFSQLCMSYLEHFV